MTADDNKQARYNAKAIAGDYESFLSMLMNYHTLLKILFGKRCHHTKQVGKVISAIRDNFQKNFGLPREAVERGHIIWCLHCDARQFFSQLLDELDVMNGDSAESYLDHMLSCLRENTPYTNKTTPPEFLPKIKDKRKQDKDRYESGTGGGQEEHQHPNKKLKGMEKKEKANNIEKF